MRAVDANTVENTTVHGDHSHITINISGSMKHTDTHCLDFLSVHCQIVKYSVDLAMIEYFRMGNRTRGLDALFEEITPIGRLINEEDIARELLHQVLFFSLLYESICTEQEIKIPTEFGSSIGSYQASHPFV